MIAEILCVGTELLLGDIVNTNAAWIAKELASLGVSVYRQVVIGDNHQRLKEAYGLALQRADIVISTGGLGPTQDDLTKEALAQACSLELQRNENAANWIQQRFIDKGFTLTENNWRQANFPVGSTPLFNEYGTAPGCMLQINQKTVFLMPGPPVEMKPMFQLYIKPWIQEQTKIILRSRVLKILGIGESAAEEIIRDIIDSQSNPSIAPYAKYGQVTFRITARADNEQEALALIEPMEQELRKRFKLNIFGVDDDTIESVTIDLLNKHNLTLACAESCTGGLVSSLLINVPGVSKIFKEAVIAYSNEAKAKRLNVNSNSLKKYGAVSCQVAAEMAEGVAKTAGTNIGLSTTGIAGPTGGTETKPVGLVYCGLYINGEVITKRFLFPNRSRDSIRKRAMLSCIDWLRRELIERYV